MTLLLFFYLCADVSALEYYCGNPSLGIASYQEVVKINPPSNTSNNISARDIKQAPSSDHKEDLNSPFEADDCFCCSSHAVITYTHLAVELSPVMEEHHAPNFSVHQRYTDWHLPPSYRPPRNA